MESSAMPVSSNTENENYYLSSCTESISSKVSSPEPNAGPVNPLYLPMFNKMIPNPAIPPPIVNPFDSSPKINDYSSIVNFKVSIDQAELDDQVKKMANKPTPTPKTNFELDQNSKSYIESHSGSEQISFLHEGLNLEAGKKKDQIEKDEVSLYSKINPVKQSEPEKDEKNIKMKQSIKANRISPYNFSNADTQNKINYDSHILVSRKGGNSDKEIRKTLDISTYAECLGYKEKFIEGFHYFQYNRGIGCLLCCTKKNDLYILKKLKYHDAAKEKYELAKFISTKLEKLYIQDILRYSIVDLFLICSLLENSNLVQKIAEFDSFFDKVKDMTSNCIGKFKEGDRNIAKDFFEMSYVTILDIIEKKSSSILIY